MQRPNVIKHVIVRKAAKKVVKKLVLKQPKLAIKQLKRLKLNKLFVV
jgi:hypothetical protein